MYCDIVFPSDNEKEFVDMAVRLGYSSLCFVYSPKSFKRFSSDKLKVFCGVLSDRPFSGADFIIAKANDGVRSVLESGKVDLVFDFELGERNDFIHHRNSGLNQVLCKIMKENGIGLGFSFGSVLGKSNPQFLGRVMQNIMFARKYKLKIVLASFAVDPFGMRSPKDLISFGEVLGLHQSEAVDSLRCLV